MSIVPGFPRHHTLSISVANITVAIIHIGRHGLVGLHRNNIGSIFRKNKRARPTRLINASPPITPPTIAPALLELEDAEGPDVEEVPEGRAEAGNADEKEAEDEDEDKDEVEVGISVNESMDTGEIDARPSVVVTGAAFVDTASRWSVIGDAPQAM
jgi:hypothetical protein